MGSVQMGQGGQGGGQGFNPLLAGGIGAGVGAAGALGLASYSQTVKDAKMGKWTGVVSLGLGILGGNQATPQVNGAMEDANAITAANEHLFARILVARFATITKRQGNCGDNGDKQQHTCDFDSEWIPRVFTSLSIRRVDTPSR